jgi:hypothetical protein
MKTYGEWVYRFTYPWSQHCWRWLASFTPLPFYPWGKSLLVPSGYKAGWAPGLVWLMWGGEISCSYQESTSDPSAIQSVARRYTDCATLAPVMPCYLAEIYWYFSGTYYALGRWPRQQVPSKSPVIIYQIKQHHIPEDNGHSHHWGNAHLR